MEGERLRLKRQLAELSQEQSQQVRNEAIPHLQGNKSHADK